MEAPPDTPSLPARIVILGITGDLARRFLVPAIAALDDAGRLSADVDLIGVGRADLSNEELRAQLAGSPVGQFTLYQSL